MIKSRERALWEYQGAMAEQIEEGREEGREEGAYNKAIESAKKMLMRGFRLADVADISGLPLSEVQNLRVQ